MYRLDQSPTCVHCYVMDTQIIIGILYGSSLLPYTHYTFSIQNVNRFQCQIYFSRKLFKTKRIFSFGMTKCRYLFKMWIDFLVKYIWVENYSKWKDKMPISIQIVNRFPCQIYLSRKLFKMRKKIARPRLAKKQ